MKPVLEPTTASLAGREEAFGALNDEALFLEFSRTRDMEALAELARRWHKPAFRIARSICLNDSLAEEAVQDGFVELLAQRTTFVDRGPGAFRSWFLTLITNRARMARRRERRSDRKRKVEPQSFIQRKGLDPSAQPEREIRGEVQGALDEIDERLRLPLVLYFMEGLRQQEVASMLGVSQQTISQRIEQGLQQLRLRFAQAGLAVAAPLLTETLQGGALYPAPASLPSALSGGKLAAAASQVAKHSIRAVAKQSAGASSLGWWVAGVLAVAAGAGAWVLTGQRSHSAPPAEVRASESPAEDVTPEPIPSVTEETPKPEEPPGRLAYWRFDEGQPKDFRILSGTWEWLPPKDGQPGMMSAGLNNKLLIACPVETPRKPFEVRIRVHSGREEGKVNSGAFWCDDTSMLAREFCWQPTPMDGEIRICFVGRNVVQYSGEQVFSVRRAETPYPTDRIGFWIMNLNVEAIELRLLEDAEITPEMKDPRKLMRTMSPCVRIPANSWEER